MANTNTRPGRWRNWTRLFLKWRTAPPVCPLSQRSTCCGMQKPSLLSLRSDQIRFLEKSKESCFKLSRRWQSQRKIQQIQLWFQKIGVCYVSQASEWSDEYTLLSIRPGKKLEGIHFLGNMGNTSPLKLINQGLCVNHLPWSQCNESEHVREHVVQSWKRLKRRHTQCCSCLNGMAKKCLCPWRTDGLCSKEWRFRCNFHESTRVRPTTQCSVLITHGFSCEFMDVQTSMAQEILICADNKLLLRVLVRKLVPRFPWDLFIVLSLYCCCARQRQEN